MLTSGGAIDVSVAPVETGRREGTREAAAQAAVAEARAVERRVGSGVAKAQADVAAAKAAIAATRATKAATREIVAANEAAAGMPWYQRTSPVAGLPWGVVAGGAAVLALVLWKVARD